MTYSQKSLFARAAQLLSIASICVGGNALIADLPANFTIVSDSSGNEVAVWELDSDDGTQVIQSSLYPDPSNPGNWTSPSTTISTSTAASDPTMVATTLGDVVAAWYFYDDVNGVYSIAASTLSTSDLSTGWSDQVIITPITQDILDFKLSINDSSGEVVLLWQAFDDSGNINLFTATMSTFGGSWSTFQNSDGSQSGTVVQVNS